MALLCSDLTLTPSLPMRSTVTYLLNQLMTELHRAVFVMLSCLFSNISGLKPPSIVLCSYPKASTTILISQIKFNFI